MINKKQQYLSLGHPVNYQFKTHCPNCFRESLQAICRHCQFNRDDYLKHDAANHHLPLFTKLDKGYVVGRVLGEGGFAVVYAALREADNLSFAVKEYYPEALASRGLDGCTVQPKRKESDRLTIWQRRFEQEGELLRRCQDYPPIAGVVRFADLIKQHNTAYLAMERLHGNSLRLYLTEAKTAQWIISWLNPLLDTLAQLHGRAIFHRDISPNNVFLTADNKPVLMDFGLAREGIRDSALKSSTVGAGTEGFIAPEQTMEATSSRVDARTDLYSLGGLIYMALLGELPPSAAHRAQGAQLKRCKNASGLTAQLEKLAFHCLELNRDKRPENVAVIQKQYALLPQPSISAKTIVPNFTPSESQAKKLPQNNEIYRIIGEEMARKEYQKGLTTRAFAEAKGDKELAKSLYIQFRYEELFAQMELERELAQKQQQAKFTEKWKKPDESLKQQNCKSLENTQNDREKEREMEMAERKQQWKIDRERNEYELAKKRAEKLEAKKLAEKQRMKKQTEPDTARKNDKKLYFNRFFFYVILITFTFAVVVLRVVSRNTPTVNKPPAAVAAVESPPAAVATVESPPVNVDTPTTTQETINFLNGKYVGEVKNGKPDGQGTFFYQDGDKYVGEFKNGVRRRDSYGAYYSKDGTVTSGLSKEGKFSQ